MVARGRLSDAAVLMTALAGLAVGSQAQAQAEAHSQAQAQAVTNAIIQGIDAAEEDALGSSIPLTPAIPLPLPLPTAGVVVEIEGGGDGFGDGFLDEGIMKALVDAMLAPIVQTAPGFGGSTLHVIGAPPMMIGRAGRSLFHRHGMFTPHSSIMRHPHAGHCYQDSQDLCQQFVEDQGIMGMIGTLRCISENAHRVSPHCKETVSVNTLPCIEDMQVHCSGSASLHSCFGDKRHQFSSTCNDTLAKASKHPAIITAKKEGARQKESISETAKPETVSVEVNSTTAMQEKESGAGAESFEMGKPGELTESISQPLVNGKFAVLHKLGKIGSPLLAILALFTLASIVGWGFLAGKQKRRVRTLKPAIRCAKMKVEVQELTSSV